MSGWIEMIPPESATGRLRELYDAATTPHGTVDNVMRAHSLRPETLAGHVALYRSVLHNPDNALPFWFLEAVASYVSLLNRCHYATAHHGANMRRLAPDQSKGQAMFAALACDRPEDAFSGLELALLRYARKVTVAIGEMSAGDIESCRAAGADDGQILEVNQVAAYFAFSNRVLNGLGVTTEGDRIGYYPAEKD
ncbi:peroxidase-related enzyme [Alphaproteobacteria bacterium HT1-32]|nr:peroxidase-related enzyme [Alphaproteobacteria bacterium HT1-32]